MDTLVAPAIAPLRAPILADEKIRNVAHKGMEARDVEVDDDHLSHRERIGVITLTRAIALLDQAVAVKGPDYVYCPKSAYEGCVNFNSINPDGGPPYTGGPACLIGHVWDLLGINPGTVPELGAFLRCACATSVIDKFGLRFTPKARALFTAVQFAQDQRVPWGECVAQATRVVAASSWDDYE